jgi:hypothetical protein
VNKLLIFLNKIGNVGGVARFVARGYVNLSNYYEDKKDVFKAIIRFRYSVLKDKQKENELYKRVDDYIDNLCDLSLSILNVENNEYTSKLPIIDFIQIYGITRREIIKKVREGDIVGKMEESKIPLIKM